MASSANPQTSKGNARSTMNKWIVITSILVGTLAIALYSVHGTLLSLNETFHSLNAFVIRIVPATVKSSNTEPLSLQNAYSTDSWNIIEHLGGNSPWIPKRNGIVGGGIGLPDGCYVDQVNMLSRHAERYPTVAVGSSMLELYQRIRRSNMTLKGDLAFANDWEFFTAEPTEHFESLVSTGTYAGTLQAFTTGVKLRTRYKHLIDVALEHGFTSFWASDSKRVIDSAKYFAAGFFGIDWKDFATLHVIPETPHRGANTLTPGRTCLRYRNNADQYGHNHGYEMRDAFRRTYEPGIVNRLAQQNPEVPFTEAEVFVMQQICGFETIAKGSSPWCDVFTREEMESFEYSRDVIHYYRAGPSNPHGGSMGWLWLNATSSLLQEGSAIGTLFFSFVHNGDIIPVLNALDLFPQTPELPVSYMLQNRTWRVSDVVPMGGRLILERVICPAPQHCWSNAPFYPNHVYCAEQMYNVSVRVNINDGIVPIPGCQDGPGESCPLERFTGRVRRRGTKVGSFRKVCGLEDDAPQRITFLHQ